MDLEAIKKEWEEDSHIPIHQLDETSRRTPILHSKYLHMRSMAKFKLERAEYDLSILELQKWKYYNGKMDEDELRATGWDLDPFDGLKVLKGDMDLYYKADPELQKAKERIAYYKEIISTLTDYVDSLKWRHQSIKNMIDWRRFEAGG